MKGHGQDLNLGNLVPKSSAPTSQAIGDKQEGLTHRGDIGQLILSLLRVEQVCLALLYGGSPQSSNNGNMAREKDVTLFARATILTECVLRARRSVRDILHVVGLEPRGNPVWWKVNSMVTQVLLWSCYLLCR